MLKGIDPLLGPDLLHILRAMGHGDEIAIVDTNYPAETDGRRCVRLDGVPGPRIVDAILSVMPLDEFVPEAAWRPEVKGGDDLPVFQEFVAAIRHREPAFSLHALDQQLFYERVKACFAVVASGERRLYGNIILKKGVIRPD